MMLATSGQGPPGALSLRTGGLGPDMNDGSVSDVSAGERRAGDAAVRVLVADDHEFFRGVICELVDATPGFRVVAVAGCGESALSAAAAAAPDFVLMDIRMPGLGGLGAAQQLLELHPELVVLLVSAHELPEALPPGLAGRAVSLIAKRELRNALLCEVWDARPKPGSTP